MANPVTRRSIEEAPSSRTHSFRLSRLSAIDINAPDSVKLDTISIPTDVSQMRRKSSSALQEVKLNRQFSIKSERGSKSCEPDDSRLDSNSSSEGHTSESDSGNAAVINHILNYDDSQGKYNQSKFTINFFFH